jgi:glycosyltransferase involved in cell wall biosynthesis
MKIAVVIPTLTVGGAEKIALETATGFAEAGHDVSLIILSDKVILSTPENIKIYKGVSSIYRLIMVMKKLRIDHCVSYMERANLVSAISCRILNIKHCATVHTAPVAGFKLRSRKNRLAISLTYRLLSLLNIKIVGVCKGIIADLNKLYGITNSYVIPNFLDVDETIKSSKLEQIDEVYDFIFVGRLTKIKGCHIFIEALGRIKDYCHVENVKVAIIGDGPEKEDLLYRINKYELQNCVQMLGPKKNPYPYIKKAKSIVVPSYAEGFGMVVLEGLALGTKVIFSRCDFGPKEIIGTHFKELCSLGFENPSINAERAVAELSIIIKSEINDALVFDSASAQIRVALNYNKQKACELFLDVLDR